MSDNRKRDKDDYDDEALVRDLRAAVRLLNVTEAELNAVRNPKRSALAGVVKRLRRRILGTQ